MFEGLTNPNHDDESLIAELQRNTTANIRYEREYERFAVSASLDAFPANLSSPAPAEPGRTVDVSAGGCMGVFEAPLHVGDVYRLRVRGTRAMPEIFARCLRVKMLRERAFEAGFVFLTPVDLSMFDELADDLAGPPLHARAG